MADKRLETYPSKRDFRRSPEPEATGDKRRVNKDRNPVFVIQEHDGSQLHYDLRL